MPPPVLRLTADHLQQLIAETLTPVVPPGHTNAVVGTLDQTGVQLLVSFKQGPDRRWSVTGAIRHDWSGDTSGAASVVYSW